jgi:hypothetical protein
MTDAFHGHARFFVDLSFEIKQAKHSVDTRLDLLDPPLFPCPDLRADKIDDGNIVLLQAFCQAEIQRGRINQDCGRRFSPCRFGYQILQGTVSFREPGYDLGDSDQRHLVDIHEGLNAGGAHGLTATTEYLHIGHPGLERLSQRRTVHVAGPFAGNH